MSNGIVKLVKDIISRVLDYARTLFDRVLNYVRALSKRKPDKKPSLDRTLKMVAIGLVISSIIIGLLTTVGEFIASRHSVAGYRKPAVTTRLPEKVTKLNPPVPPLEIMPTDVVGFETTFRQQVPGELNAAEAIYKSSNEDLSPTAPIDTYVRITYYGSVKEARDSIRRAVKDQYHQDSKMATVGKQPVYTGYDGDYGSYYLAWNWQNYAIEVTTSYKESIPKERGNLQSKLSSMVAQSLVEVLQRSVK